MPSRRAAAGPPDPLAGCRAKRDFARTAKPTGGGDADDGSGWRFVVHKHAARRLHHDLRLELGRMLKSWAVPQGPSLDPAKRRRSPTSRRPVGSGCSSSSTTATARSSASRTGRPRC